jgi:hypothetical protein
MVLAVGRIPHYKACLKFNKSITKTLELILVPVAFVCNLA